MEAVISGAHPDLESLGAAFSIERGDAELVVVVQEPPRAISATEASELIENALAAIAAEQGIRLYDLRLVGRIDIASAIDDQVFETACDGEPIPLQETKAVAQRMDRCRQSLIWEQSHGRL